MRDQLLRKEREVSSQGTATGRIGECHHFVTSRLAWLVQQRRQSTVLTLSKKLFKEKTRWSGGKQWTVRWLAFGNGVYELVDKPKDKNVVKSKWVFRVKTNEKGEVEKYKARVGLRGTAK